MQLLLRNTWCGLVCAASVLCAVDVRAQAEADLPANMVANSQRWLESAVVQAAPVQGRALRMEVLVGALDPRLQLAPCAKVEPYMPPGTRLWGKSRLGLRCLAGTTRWNVFMPVTVKAMGRADLVGNGKHHLIPTFQPLNDGAYQSARKKNSTALPVKAGVAAPAKPCGQVLKGPAATPTKTSNQPVKGRMLTQHTGLPPRVTGAAAKTARKPR